MMKAIKLSAVVAIAALATGCASTSDLEALDARVSTLESKVSGAEAAAKSAASDAASAKSSAAAAEAAANRAARLAEEVNSKLDRLFKKSQHK